MLKKQVITTEEYDATGNLTRKIVEENEYSDDTLLQVPYQVPCTPNDVPPAKPWWEVDYYTGTTTLPAYRGSVTVTLETNKGDQDGKD